MRSLGSTHVTVVPSTVEEPLCDSTSPGNFTETRKSENMPASTPSPPASGSSFISNVHTPSLSVRPVVLSLSSLTFTVPDMRQPE